MLFVASGYNSHLHFTIATKFNATHYHTITVLYETIQKQTLPLLDVSIPNQTMPSPNCSKPHLALPLHSTIKLYLRFSLPFISVTTLPLLQLNKIKREAQFTSLYFIIYSVISSHIKAPLPELCHWPNPL